MSDEDRQRLIRLARLAVTNFNAGDWQELGVHTGALDAIRGHDRLLRSLSFNDPDYSGNAHGVLFSLVERDPRTLQIIAAFIRERYGDDGELVSSSGGGGRTVVFTPSVFEVPEGGVEADLIAVMTPFSPDFEAVFETIARAAGAAGYRRLRAKDLGQHSAVIQDVFALIFKAHIVVCDFTGRNPNVFYEAGIAHTLGKHVVPITQAGSDIPFDLQHHRYLAYLNNGEGRQALEGALRARFTSLRR